MTVYERLDNATPREVIDYLKERIAEKTKGASPQEIGGYITGLLGCHNPWLWYEQNKYPLLTKVMDLAPDLEIGNVESEDLALRAIEQLVSRLDIIIA